MLAFGGKGEDLNPIDLVAMGVASCLMIVMAKSGEGKGIDLTGTWADADYDLKDYKIASVTMTIHSPYSPAEAEREFLEKESRRCPVYLAVKDGVAVKVVFDWERWPSHQGTRRNHAPSVYEMNALGAAGERLPQGHGCRQETSLNLAASVDSSGRATRSALPAAT